MDAHPVPAEPTNGRRFADATSDGVHTVFRVLADGAWHRLDDLAADTADTPDRVRELIATLAARGVAIDSRRGAIRSAPCVALDARSIERVLQATQRPPDALPWQARVVFATGSTNDDLLAEIRANPDVRGPALRAAEIQHKGRGRLGRSWISAPGTSLTASFALRIARPLAQLDGVTLACGLAVHGVLAAFGAAARLKWPNDILVDGHKLAGILVEATAVPGGTALVVGVGINVAAMPQAAGGNAALPPGGTACLQQAGAEPVDRNELVARLGLALEAQLTQFAATGFRAFAGRWNAVDAYRDLPVRLTSAWDADVDGIARGVDDGGALLLDSDGERRRIIAGDVSLRLASPPVAHPAP